MYNYTYTRSQRERDLREGRILGTLVDVDSEYYLSKDEDMSPQFLVRYENQDSCTFMSEEVQEDTTEILTELDKQDAVVLSKE